MFRKMPFILVALILAIGLIQPYLPILCQQTLYALSLSIKSLIVFCLPLIIFLLLLKTSITLTKQASKLILLILGAICLSNFLSTMIAYNAGMAGYQLDLSMSFPKQALQLQPAWEFSLPKWIENTHAMIAGLGLGILLGRFKPFWAAKIASHVETVVEKLLSQFLYVIPLFISGFVMKMYHDQVMGFLVQNYGMIFLLVGASVFAYIALLYFIASRSNKASFTECLKNMMPSAIAGFGTMSSVAAMPLTLLGTEKNSNHPHLARAVIPATVNIHLIGDCFAIPIFAFAILKSFGIASPCFANYLIFACYFVLAKFSVAAVPGGGILVMLPILEQYLGFDASMLSLITALYILFDPVITCANILGNGAFAIGLARLFGKKEALASSKT